jgi:hypothetical protein
VTDVNGGIDGFRVLSDGFYDLNISAMLENFAPDQTTPVPFTGTQDVRMWIDDVGFAFPVSPYGQTMQLDNQNVLANLQPATLAFSAQIYLREGQQVTFGFLYTSPDSLNTHRLTLEFGISRSKNTRAGGRCGTSHSGRTSNMP